GDEIRLLARVAEARAAGQDTGAMMRRLRIFGAHERLALQALGRVPARAWPSAVQHAHEVDRLIKGLHVPGRLADPWEEMTRLALRVAAAGRAWAPTQHATLELYADGTPRRRHQPCKIRDARY